MSICSFMERLRHDDTNEWFTLHRRLGHRASPAFDGWAPRQASAPALGAFRFQWVVQRRPEESSEPLGFNFMYTEGRCQAGGVESRGLAVHAQLVQHGKFHNQKGSHVTERGAKEVTDLLHKVAEAGGLDDLPRWPEDTERHARDKGELQDWSQATEQ